MPGSLTQTICGIYRTFSATTRPQTTSEITDAATKAKIVRFFSFNSLNPETTTKKFPLLESRLPTHAHSRSLTQGPGAFRHQSVSAARVTLEHRRLSVTNLAHDLHGSLAVRTEGDLGSGQERHHPQSPLASTPLGGRSHGDVTIWEKLGSCTGVAVDVAAARPGAGRGRATLLLLGQRWENRTAARERTIVVAISPI